MKIIKTEGPTDLLALISSGLRPDESACCNVHGCDEDPHKTTWLLGFVRGHDVLTIHDADEPGQAGATMVEGRPGWATYMAKTAATSRLAKLPYPVTKTKGKDLRDFFAEGHTREDFDKLVNQAEDMKPAAADPATYESYDNPHRLARINLQQYRAKGRNLVIHNGEWMAWKRGCYRKLEEDELRAKLNGAIKGEYDRAFVANEIDLDNVPKVTPQLVSSVLQATKSIVGLSSSVEHPSWLSDSPPFPATEAIATSSGILHLPSLVSGQPSFVSPTPDLFSRNCLPYPFDPVATCPTWDQTLAEFWPDDHQSRQTLQEWFGYSLTPDTSQHKILMLVGPPRSGKGTIGRVLQAVIGRQNLASPTLASLAGPFGLQPLVGKLVALVADARLSSRTDGIAVVERLLSISGEDPQDVHRKNISALEGVSLPVRFVVMTNELPNVHDASGALMTRVVLVRMSKTFGGIEDRSLLAKLLKELPGILNWAIAGWHRLNQRGYFVQPDSGRDLLDDLQDLASPIRAFVRDVCIIGPELEISIDEIFELWDQWCQDNGKEHSGKKQLFARDLISAFPNLKRKKTRLIVGRELRYVGIGKREKNQDQEKTSDKEKFQAEIF